MHFLYTSSQLEVYPSLDIISPISLERTVAGHDKDFNTAVALSSI